MRVATWNVNGLRARLDFARLWLRERRPDVVALQELKLTEDLFPHAELEEEGYRAVAHCQAAWNGVAVLVRDPAGAVELAGAGLPGQEDLGARLVTAALPGLSVTSVYVPNGKSVAHADFARKLEWLDALAGHLAATVEPAAPAVVAGDFNICPAPIDSWNEGLLEGTIFHTVEERACFRRILDAGLADLFREQEPETPGLSWWDYRAGAFHRGHGLRIDLVLGTPAIRERVRSVTVDREWRKKKDGLTPSDHAPVVIDLA